MVKKVNAIDTSGLLKKKKKKKKKNDNKITEIEGKIPNITSLATTSVKSKVPNDCDLVKRVQYDVKISDIHFASSDYYKLMNGILDAKMKNK